MARVAALPPKMLTHYAELAKDGKAAIYNKGVATFYNSHQKISIIHFEGDFPMGLTEQMSEKEWQARHIAPKVVPVE